ncbi:hypothetical protein [Bacillus suaedaesalsae]|uniref:Uncharacterized protein n=1 Tax=Bacillus suaedaesalsae TaxID=2810349 RepID=A0ABS2DDZ6_9BACI|nr:hypothetical protein [Bacillus suaedaesalsae]MBM6616677.1 hypothetical protein [Bacillus suaedaesalsae]
MVLKFILILCISILLLFSLKYLKKRFDSFEVFLLLLFTSYNIQNFFYLLSSPYPHLMVVEKHLQFWAARIHYGVISPVLLLWVMYVLRGNKSLSLKIATCFSWVTGGVLFDKVLLIIGVLKSKGDNWHPEINLVLSMVVLSSSIYFMEILKKILLKERVIHDE